MFDGFNSRYVDVISADDVLEDLDGFGGQCGLSAQDTGFQVSVEGFVGFVENVAAGDEYGVVFVIGRHDRLLENA